MPRQVFDYVDPERFVAGTVGQPGQRTFFLQARTGPRLTSVVAEKRQVAILAERMHEMLDEVDRRAVGPDAPVPAATPLDDAPAGTVDTAPLDTPIEEEFRVGTMSLSWDPAAERVVVECFADGDEAEDEDDESGDGAVLRIHMTGAYARSFVTRALAVVAAGRPPCPFCDLPLDADGHICPRANGYRR